MRAIRDRLANVVHVIDILQYWILVVIFSATVIVGSMQILARFVFRMPLPWSEELLRMSFIWVTFIGASLGMSRGIHLSVNFFPNLLPRLGTSIIGFMSKLVAIGFAVTAIVLCWNFWWAAYHNAQRSAGMEIPMTVPYFGLLFAFCCMTIQLIKQLFDFFVDNAGTE